jgi:DNA polymerase III delta prime subunit
MVILSSPNQPLMLKYRPHIIDDFCIDSNTKTAIRALLDIDDINILMVGGGCSGKTTLLYAIVREYYGFSKEKSLPENNIMFINNLKEQGINFYRNDMKTFCQSHSTIPGKKKMVVIDDIDTINEQSQQIFRTYIDKYKHNIHFVSVCTNIQKVIESIQSRLHIMRIQHPTPLQVRNLMDVIVEKENLSIDPESCVFILSYCQYSIRSLINYLEKIKILGIAVTYDMCAELVCDISFKKFEEYIIAIRNNNVWLAIRILYDIHDYGYSVIDILEYIFTFVKMTDLLSESEKYTVVPLICKYIAIFNITHEDSIELALFTNNIMETLNIISDKKPSTIKG